MPGHGPQQRPLDPAERSLLHRVIGWIADDPRWQLAQIAVAAADDQTIYHLKAVHADTRAQIWHAIHGRYRRDIAAAARSGIFLRDRTLK